MSDNAERNDMNRSMGKENFSTKCVKIIHDWSRKKGQNSSGPNVERIEPSRPDNNSKNSSKESGFKAPRRLKSFNLYLTDEDKVKSVNEYSDVTPSGIEGTYKYDFNIISIHNAILDKFKYEKDHKVNRLEEALRDEEIKINRRQNMVERKASLKRIRQLGKEIEDILTDRRYMEYLKQITPLINQYSLLGSLSKIISFAKNRKDEDDLPEDPENQRERHQLILDFIEIARKYIQIDLIREVKEGNYCEACGTNLDEAPTDPDDGGVIVCPNCCVEKLSVIRTRFYHDNARTNNSGNNYEDRANFWKVLMCYQGKQSDKPPRELYETLKEYFISRETPKIDIEGKGKGVFVTPSYIKNQLPLNSDGAKKGTSRSLMYKALKETGNSRYYDHINIILHKIWGWSLPDVSHLEDQIMNDYDLSQRVYETIPKDRKSSLNSQFRLYKHLRRLHYPCKSKDFKIPTTHDILEFHKTVWSKICQTLGWENL